VGKGTRLSAELPVDDTGGEASDEVNAWP
jgi:hypothetical protein